MRDLSDFSLDEFSEWPLSTRLMTIAIGCVFVLGMIYWFDTRLQYQTLKKAESNESRLQQEFELKQRLSSNLPAYRDQAKDMNQSFEILAESLPKKAEVPSLLEDISIIGSTSGLHFLLFEPLMEKKHEFYAELPIKMSVVGDYHHLASFASQVADLPRVVTFHDFTLEKTSDKEKRSGDLKMDITAKTYHSILDKKG